MDGFCFYLLWITAKNLNGCCLNLFCGSREQISTLSSSVIPNQGWRGTWSGFGTIRFNSFVLSLCLSHQSVVVCEMWFVQIRALRKHITWVITQHRPKILYMNIEYIREMISFFSIAGILGRFCVLTMFFFFKCVNDLTTYGLKICCLLDYMASCCAIVID